MSEYTHVEQPFLQQLHALGWAVIDQGTEHPSNPADSERPNFRQVILEARLKDAVGSINRTDDGRPWLTDAQLDQVLSDVYSCAGVSLVESNKAMLELLFEGARVDRNELTGEESPPVRLIDFDNPERNDFLAINQFRVDTPGGVKTHIIPDIVLFVNGLPLVVIECKSADEVTADPMHEAFRQLMRYSDQRPEAAAAGLREGAPRLFHANQVLIRACGERAEFGTITATDPDYFFPWRDIVPKTYREYEPPLGRERDQEVLIQGMLPPETLLDLVRTCTVFMNVDNRLVKVMARYQQYRAMQRIIQRLREGDTPQERSGVVWHTQGSGKSLTMVFTVRKLRVCDDLRDLKVLMVNDRLSLEDQLTKTAHLTGEKPTVIGSTEELKQELSGDKSNLNMVMMHKFQESSGSTPDYVSEALGEAVPQYEQFGVVNDSERILILIDEAHRTQYSDLGNNLFEAFPNASKIAFSGTPLIVREGKRELTHERFGTYVDKYKLEDSTSDGVTVPILYEGRTAEAEIADPDDFDAKFENLFSERTPGELRAIREKYGTTGDILEAPARIEAIAEDLVDHYIAHILPNGFKAQVVANSKLAAVRYEEAIRKALDRRIEEEAGKDEPDITLLEELRFLKVVTVISADGTNDPAPFVEAQKRAKQLNAVGNFKDPFDHSKPNTGIAFLVVCDMLLTGFDARIEQVMYLDKKVRHHNLLQTIARVNRVAKGKTYGYIVDYIGLAHHLQEALSIYGDDEDAQDAQQALKDIESELPVLERRYRRLVQLFREAGIDGIEGFAEQALDTESTAVEVREQAIQLMEDIEMRAEFEVRLKQFLQSLDAILPNPSANAYRIPAKRFGYLMNQVRQRFKDDSLNLEGAGEKVKGLVDEHLISLGIDPKIGPRELTSTDFVEGVEQHTTPRAKASEMEHAIRKHLKVHFEEDPAFYTRMSEKLEALLERHRENWEQLSLELYELRDEATSGRREGEYEGLSSDAAAFYERIGQIAFDGGEVPDEHADDVKALVHGIIDELVQTIGLVNFWERHGEIEDLETRLRHKLLASDIDPIVENRHRIVTEILDLARRRGEELFG